MDTPQNFRQLLTYLDSNPLLHVQTMFPHEEGVYNFEGFKSGTLLLTRASSGDRFNVGVFVQEKDEGGIDFSNDGFVIVRGGATYTFKYTSVVPSFEAMA